MKRIALRGRKSPALPHAWREAEYAALRANAADTYDERAEVDIIVNRMMHDAN